MKQTENSCCPDFSVPCPLSVILLCLVTKNKRSLLRRLFLPPRPSPVSLNDTLNRGKSDSRPFEFSRGMQHVERLQIIYHIASYQNLHRCL